MMRRSISKIMRALLFLPWALLWSHSTLAAQNFYALLIGVSEYPSLEEQLQLSGPANDVASYYQMLLDRGVPAGHIQLIADKTGIASARQPTRSEILDGFHRLEQALRASPSAERFAFVLMAGHGSQMPAAADDRTEADGLDEIFLPRDVGKWNGEIGTLPNAIADNELGQAIDRLRATGAFVWAVFDNCHSGTMTRGSGVQGEKSRQVPPAALGIPPKVLAAAERRVARQRTRNVAAAKSQINASQTVADKGGFVAFYASQSYETTPEYLLPQFASDATQRGLFSYTLQQVLSVSPGATYRQIAEKLLQRYRALGRISPTPTIEGSGQDAVVFGSQIMAAPRQWPVETSGEQMLLRAGQLQEITNGSILAVVPEATSDDAKVAGYVEVISAGATQSSVRPIGYGDKPPLDKSKLTGGGAYARPAQISVDFSLRVAQPIATNGCDAPTPAMLASIEQLKGQSDIAHRVQWVVDGEPAAIRLCASKNRLLLTAADADKSQAMVVDIRPDATIAKRGTLSANAVALGAALDRVGRAINLIRLVSSGNAADTLLKFELDYERNCSKTNVGCVGVRTPINPLDLASLRKGDNIRVTVTNISPYASVDFSALYVDANYGISILYPGNDESARLEPRGHTAFDFDIDARSLGREKLMFVAVPVEPQTPEVRFDSLAQEGLTPAQSRATRRDAQNPLAELLQEAAFGDNRGVIRRAQNATQLITPQVSLYEWHVSN